MSTFPNGRNPLRKQSAKRRRQNAKRFVAERHLFEQRPYCWRCGTRGGLHGHEILGRSQGGDPTNPDCLLCNRCNGWCKDHPVGAAWFGWKKSKKHPAMPCIASGSCLPWEHQGCDAA